MIPTSYEQWRHWIEVRGRIRLTSSYISERLAELEDESHTRTKDFARVYGTSYLQSTIEWFRRAAVETAG
ncbi:MAG: hypothetical protein AAFU85_28190 [Planctomycetota bacterium]